MYFLYPLRCCLIHFPVGMLGIQSSFHSAPLQYFQVQVLEGKKTIYIGKKETA